LRVLINALGVDTGGAANHLNHFIPAIEKSSTQNLYWILCREKFYNQQLASKKIQFIKRSTRSAQSFLSRLYLDNFSTINLIKQNKIDILVSLTNFGPISAPIPHICFQRNSLYFSSWYQQNAPLPQKIENTLRSFLTKKIMQNSNLVVTPSKSMALMIQETFPNLKANDFRTLYHGFNVKEESLPLEKEILNRLDCSQFNILYPTLPAFHKGVFLIFEMIRELKSLTSEPFKVLLTFSESEALNCYGPKPIPKDWHELSQYVTFMGKLAQKSMRSLYKTCQLMFYPSLCESFGFSMVEAMGSELPIIAVDTPINREMCRDSALYFPSSNPHLAAQHIKTLMTSPPARLDLINHGKERISQFDWSWTRYAQEFESLLSLV